MARRTQPGPRGGAATARTTFAGATKSGLGGLPRFRLRGRHVWILASTAVVGLAAVNATVLQGGTHPAPLFAEPATPGAMSVRQTPRLDAGVLSLQSRLQAMGYYDGALDGVMGPATLDAVYAALDGADVAATATQARQIASKPPPRATPDSLAALLRDAAGPTTPPVRQVSASAETVVRTVQERLTERGYDPGPLDGMMGRGTRAAIGMFQEDEGLAVTGEIDAPTLARLGVPASG